MIARAGSGHIGTASAAWTSWPGWTSRSCATSRVRTAVRDLYFSSKGHDVPGLYAVLIGLGACHSRTSPAAAPRRPARPPRRRRRRASSPTPARSAWASRRPRAWCSRNRLEGRTGRIFVLTGDGELQEGQFWESLATDRAREARRDHGHRRPQQDPVGHVVVRRSATSATSRPRSRASAGRSSAATATTSPRSAKTLAGAARRARPPQADHRRHGQGQGRVVHGAHRARAPTKAVPLPQRRARRREPTSAALAELDRRGQRACSRRSEPAPLELERVRARRAADLAGATTAWSSAYRVRSCARPSGPANRGARRRPGGRHRARSRSRAVPRPVHRVRHRRAGHGVPGGRAGARRACCRCPLVRLLPVDARQRADLQQRDRAAEGHLCRLARGPAARRAGALAPVRARHRRAGGHAGTGDAGALL